MNPGDPNNAESQRQALRQQLKAAETALGANLNLPGVDETGRAHMERALIHVREAYIAINEGQARSVQQLVGDIVKVERRFEQLRQKPTPGGGIKP